jgi:hypothetical protein
MIETGDKYIVLFYYIAFRSHPITIPAQVRDHVLNTLDWDVGTEVEASKSRKDRDLPASSRGIVTLG